MNKLAGILTNWISEEVALVAELFFYVAKCSALLIIIFMYFLPFHQLSLIFFILNLNARGGARAAQSVPAAAGGVEGALAEARGSFHPP